MYRRIRELRTDSDLSQTQFAQILGMSQTGYSKYETGENDIPTEILIAIANYYRTSVDYLLGLTDIREAYPRKRK
ncbi:helix-turn-helix domain-containing protein [Caproiciproducens sp.]|uniref:helix-turn-helix domain-containing protein n=1 Tax=Caproiciproducens sp. TaxID=1954376 RepID=UPI0028984A8A|nr:helix-turn-helix transcriptional regulator [Caproiciproducens sp.]